MWLDETKELYEHRHRDTWQLPVISRDGWPLGQVISQIIQPQEYLIRYFLVYSPGSGRFLLPAEVVSSIDEAMVCTISHSQAGNIPPIAGPVTRVFESEIHQALGLEPYWQLDA